MFGITGATGKLGRLAIDALLTTEPPQDIAALVRSPDKAADLAARGVSIREADYDRPETLQPALSGIDTLLLIASSALGRRVPQHQAVIDAAKAAGVKLIAYTSVLRADTSELAVAAEHRRTEELLAASGVPFVLLRNGWYTENYTFALPAVLQQGAVLGSSGEGRIASASRADYAAAAAAVLAAGPGEAGKIYELAGDRSFTMAELAAEIARQSARQVVYRDLPEAEYRAMLAAAGFPDFLAASFARSSAAAGSGALLDDRRQLSTLIRRPTTPMRDTISAALRG